VGRQNGMRVNAGVTPRTAGRVAVVQAAYRSKFGLTVTEIMRGLEETEERGMQDASKASLPYSQPDHQHPHRNGSA
jgi:hypothetical protein